LVDLGPLTKRLVQALIEEKPSIPIAEEVDLEKLSEAKDCPELNGLQASPAGFTKVANLGNFACFERNIKQDLYDQGLLDAEDTSDDELSDDGAPFNTLRSNCEDEVTAELRKRQSELKELAIENRSRLQHWYTLALRDCNQRQPLLNRLKELDSQIIDSSNRLSCIPRKKFGKKEKDTILKTVKDREDILKELDKISNDYLF